MYGTVTSFNSDFADRLWLLSEHLTGDRVSE